MPGTPHPDPADFDYYERHRKNKTHEEELERLNRELHELVKDMPAFDPREARAALMREFDRLNRG